MLVYQMLLEHQVNQMVVFIIFLVVAEVVEINQLLKEEVLVDLVVEEMPLIVLDQLVKLEQQTLAAVVVEVELRLLILVQVVQV